MVKIIKNKKNPTLDGIQYDKLTTSIKDGILTVKAERVKQPSHMKVKLTLVTSSFSIFEEK